MGDARRGRSRLVGRSRGLLAVDLEAESRALQLDALQPVLRDQLDQFLDLFKSQHVDAPLQFSWNL
jgi:hypothetical protein